MYRKILHTGFTCSTLLARSLESIDRCFVLKEPLLLTALSGHATAEADAVLTLSLRLLRSAYTQQDTVIIKANDICNTRASFFLEHDVGSKIVCLATDLRTFLVSVLKDRVRRKWLHDRIESLGANTKHALQSAGIDFQNLTDAHAGACLWLHYQQIFRSLHEFRPASVFIMQGDLAAKVPERFVGDVAKNLEIALSDTELERVVESIAGARYSKNMSIRYSSFAHDTDRAVNESRLRPELDAGETWANVFVRRERV